MGDVFGTSSISWKCETFKKLLPGITEKSSIGTKLHEKASNFGTPEFYKTYQNKEHPAPLGCSLNGWGVADGCLTGNSFPLLGCSPEFLIFWQMFEQTFQFSSTYNIYYSNRALWKHCGWENEVREWLQSFGHLCENTWTEQVNEDLHNIYSDTAALYK